MTIFRFFVASAFSRVQENLIQQPVEDMYDPVVEQGGPLPTVDGYRLGVGTMGAGLIPALPIWTEPNGIPSLATPPGDADGVAADDEALPLELAPHAAPIPPPSKSGLGPDIPDDGLATPEHVVPLPVIPIVPVGGKLSPGDASSVAPSGIPAGGTGEPGAMPSGEVAPIPGVGLPMPPTCAKAGLQMNSVASMAAVNV